MGHGKIGKSWLKSIWNSLNDLCNFSVHLKVLQNKKFTKKSIFKRVKSQATEWRKIFAMCINCKSLTFGVYKESLQIRGKEANKPIKKWLKE